jgi:hypothetical protein
MFTIFSSSVVTEFLSDGKNSNFETVFWYPLQNKTCSSRARVYVPIMQSIKYDLVTTDMYNNVHIKTRKKNGWKGISISVISGFSDVCEFCALLGFYKVQKGILLPSFLDNLSVPTLKVKLSKKNFSWTAWFFKMRLIYCPKMSVTNYQSTLHKIPEKHKSCTLHYFLMHQPSVENTMCHRQCEWHQQNIMCECFW